MLGEIKDSGRNKGQRKKETLEEEKARLLEVRKQDKIRNGKQTRDANAGGY
jgi:hypothetical protein